MEHESINLERDYHLKYSARKISTIILIASFVYCFLILSILLVIFVFKIKLYLYWPIIIPLKILSGLSLYIICLTESDWNKKAARITEIELSDTKFSGKNINTFHSHAEKLRSFVYFEKRGAYVLYLLCKLIVCIFFLLSSAIFLISLNHLLSDMAFQVSS